MTMIDRDPDRFADAVLADPSHKLPLPDRGGRLFLAEGELIDKHHPFYAAMLADGSLLIKPAEAAVDATPAEPVAMEADQVEKALPKPSPVAAAIEKPSVQKL